MALIVIWRNLNKAPSPPPQKHLEKPSVSTLVQPPIKPPLPVSIGLPNGGPSVASIPRKVKQSDFIPPVSHVPAKKPEGVIEFRVVDGFAVAFGDLILGQVDPGSNIQKGYYDARPPQLWDSPEIPYQIKATLPNPERIERAIAYLRKFSRVNFVPYQGQKDAVLFEEGTEHCLSALGRLGGVQPIRLSDNCDTQAVLHEMMHTLGFIHEQSRPDRDQYVEVVWENIEEKYRSQFDLVPGFFSDILADSDFDYRSIMLYRPHDFAITPDLITLKTKKADPVDPIPYGLSSGDLKRLNRLYN